MSDLENNLSLLQQRAVGKKPFGKVVTFDLGAEGVITLDARGETIAVNQDPIPGDVTIGLSAADLNGLLTGRLNAQSLMMTGRAKLKGNTMVAMKLGDVLR
jgi:putative sterol carrier protein